MTRPVLKLPIIETDGGPWAMHDMACAVCHVNYAILNLNTGVFGPCWKCQDDGWKPPKKRMFRS